MKKNAPKVPFDAIIYINFYNIIDQNFQNLLNEENFLFEDLLMADKKQIQLSIDNIPNNIDLSGKQILLLARNHHDLLRLKLIFSRVKDALEDKFSECIFLWEDDIY